MCDAATVISQSSASSDAYADLNVTVSKAVSNSVANVRLLQSYLCCSSTVQVHLSCVLQHSTAHADRCMEMVGTAI